MIRALAVEHPKKRFLIARPPRMLTDQTNLPFQAQQPTSAAAVAAELMTALPISSPNLVELDLA